MEIKSINPASSQPLKLSKNVSECSFFFGNIFHWVSGVLRRKAKHAFEMDLELWRPDRDG